MIDVSLVLLFLALSAQTMKNHKGAPLFFCTLIKMVYLEDSRIL